MPDKDFKELLKRHISDFMKTVSSQKGDWTVKGFIDIFKNIYTISVDTKVISKILELMLLPIIQQFAQKNNYKMVLSKEQNHYPDISFIDDDGTKIAFDMKSTYRTSMTTVSGFTLGAFTGYFRERNSTKNITFPYNQYGKHYVLGIIYTKQENATDETKIYKIEQLLDILSVIKDFEFILYEKYQIATDRPGSGNTKNIGSVINIDELRNGRGPFTKLGIEIFDDYWMYYMTSDMARAAELSKPPYSNLKQYFEYKRLKHKKK